jgi:Ca-activated chloride channel family protein
VKRAKEEGVIIFAVGIGSPQGKPIPIRDRDGNIVEYRKGPDGQVVISSLDERSLAKIAVATGGKYFRATTSEKEIDQLYDEISKLDKKELESKLVQNYEDRFQYPLLIAILFLAAGSWINDRRKTGKPWFERFRRLKDR